MHSASDIEMIHTKFLRSVLGVKKSTNLSALYGELGRISFSVTRIINMIKYWTKILQQNNTSLLKQVYLMLKQDSDLNINYNGRNWDTQIKTILQSHGFHYVWREQADIIIPFQLIRQRILDTYKQTWYSEIKLPVGYRRIVFFKYNFELESYLNLDIDKNYKLALTRFRTSSHSLMIETGRYENIPREQRICQFCNMGKI